MSNSKYLGAVDAPKGNVAYFETTPVNPTDTKTVSFDASFARGADGTTDGLTYYWDFGDGTHATGKTVSHTYSAAQWADVKLVVAKGSDDSTWGVYRQALAVNSPTGSAPATPACGTFSAAERSALITDAKAAGHGGHAGRGEALVRVCSHRSGADRFRPRWLALAAVVAAGATPVIVSSGGAATDAPPASNPAHPVVDASWIYAKDFYNATHFIYKRAGSDGCLPGATSCAFGTPGDANNLPQNYNGTQEFNKWWGDLGTTTHRAAERRARQVDVQARSPLRAGDVADQHAGAHDPGRGLPRAAGHARLPPRQPGRHRPEPRHQRHALQHHVLGRLGHRFTV